MGTSCHDGAVTAGRPQNELDPTKRPVTPTALATTIHSTPHKMVLAFAGAGAQALAWLHSVGGSSRTILSALDIYSPESMHDFVGFMPARFTSRRVAKAMAARAYERARAYAGVHDAVFGLACTATIATDRAKRGDHRVAAAATDAFGTVTYLLVIEKDARDRVGEEEIVSRLLLQVAADSTGVLAKPALPLVAGENVAVQFWPSDQLGRLASGAAEYVVMGESGSLATELAPGARALLSGSFNPLHAGHLGLARAAGEFTGLPVLFELPVANAEKGTIGMLETRRRAQQFVGRGELALTRARLFSEKAALFPGCVFVVGLDTAERVVEPRFYGGSEEAMLAALVGVRDHGCRFLVAGRLDGDRYRTLADIAVPAGYGDLFDELPESAFRKDVASTAIRRGWNGPGGHAS